MRSFLLLLSFSDPMFDFRKALMVLVIAVLFAIFVFSTVEAIYPSPEYGDFCDNNPRQPIPRGLENECEALDVPQSAYDSCEGHISYEYDSNGCATEYFCNTCQNEYDDAREQHDRVVFYVSAILSLIAIFVALYLPEKKSKLHEWVGTGFLLGGVFVLFFGTIQGFTSLDRFIKPIVILVELVLVIYLAYKKLQ